jgi:hypothetical protein
MSHGNDLQCNEYSHILFRYRNVYGVTMTEDERQQQAGRVIAIRVPEDLGQRVEKAAAGELLSLSAYARRALLAAVRNDEVPA